MAYYGLAFASDDRRSVGLIPQRLLNCHVVTGPKTVKKGAGYVIQPAPGTRDFARPALGAHLRGLFRQDGVVNGDTFAVAGDGLYKITASGACTRLGSVAGADFVQWSGLRSKLHILGGGYIYEWDGVAFTQVTDPFVPFPAYTIQPLGNRLLASQAATDINAWSAVADGKTWPALAYAASENRPDRIEGSITLGAENWSFGSSSWQILNATGGPDETAVTALSNFVRDTGLLTRDTLVGIPPSGSRPATAVWVSNERLLMMATNYSPVPLSNKALSDRLKRLTDAQVAKLSGFNCRWGEKHLYCLRMPDGGPSMVYDFDVKEFHERETFGANIWAQAFSCEAFGATLVAGPTSDQIWVLDDNAYDDAGQTIERRMMVHLPMREVTIVDNITLDIKTTGQPLAGPHAEPKMLLRWYGDGGSHDSASGGEEREFNLGARGTRERPTEWCFGAFGGSDGMLLEFIFTAPAHFSFAGIWVNEIPDTPL